MQRPKTVRHRAFTLKELIVIIHRVNGDEEDENANEKADI